MDGSSSEEYLSADEELDSINGITSVKRDHSVEDVEDRDRECVETGEKSPPAICHLPPTSLLTTMASSARNPLASSTDDPPVVPSSTDDPLPSPVLPSSTDDPLPPPVVPSSTDDPLPPPVVPSSTDDPLPPPVVPSSTDDPLPPPVVPSLADDSADNLPVPPPRRKRKKKSEKQSSLDNNVDDAFSMTVTTDLSKERPSKTLGQPSSQERSPSPLQEGSPSPPQQEDSKGAGLVVVKGSQDEGTDDNDSHHTIIMSSSDSLLQDRISRSRSATPTPGISIEPDVGLDWTKDMLSTPRSEVVTSDTSLSKARGSNTTTTSSLAFQSDDDSVDGDQVFADDTPEEGCDSEGGGAEPKPPKPAVSGSSDSDNAILASTMVTNLDTGEVIPLSAAEEKIPQGHGWSPLSEHLIQRTAEAEGQCYEEDDYIPHQRKGRRKTFIKLKKWGRRRERMGGDEGPTQLDEAGVTEDRFAVKYKQGSHKQNNQEFDKVRLKQDLTGIHLGAIWSMEFSICGRLLATAGQDSVVRVWVLATAAIFFHELQAQYQRLGVHSSVDSLSEKASVASSGSKSSEEDDNQGGKLPFQEQPLCSYYGHTADVLDLSWSKNFFLLSSSMDKTVRLWHISRKECLCCFQHVDFVTAIAFHPRDDRYFLSGSLDGKLRLWNIPDKRVALWNEIEGVGSHLITAANFCMNGKLAVVGTYDGRCMFYDTEHLKYHTQIHVKSRHGKNKGRKISGVEPLPGEDKLLVTSNDSRIRLYNLKDHELACKYKGCLNTSSQIKATFSRDGQYIISGSEDNFIYLWKTHLDISKLSSTRRDRNEFYESFSSHSAPVTTAVFAPVPGITVDEGIKEVGEMIVAADYQGAIKIYVSGEKL